MKNSGHTYAEYGGLAEESGGSGSSGSHTEGLAKAALKKRQIVQILFLERATFEH